MYIKVNNTTLEVVETRINELSSEVGYTIYSIDDSLIPDDLLNDFYGFSQYKFNDDGYGSGTFEKYSDSNISDMESACEDECEIKEVFFYGLNHSTQINNYKCTSINETGTDYYSFVIPDDFNHLHELKLCGITQNGGSGKNIKLYSNYGGVGDSHTSTSESDTTKTFDLGNADDIIELDISSVFSNIIAGDICGLRTTHNSFIYT
jgi:hypothetical protein